MTVDYQPIATGVGANVTTQTQYLIDLAPGGTLQNGYQSGIAKSIQVNKTLRQASMIAAAVANMINVQTGIDVLDDGNLSGLITNLTLGIQEASIRGPQAADIASAATVNLDGTTGWLVDVTGTTAWTAVTLSQGRVRLVRHTGIQTLTHGASLQLPGQQNIVTKAGDYSLWAGYAAGVVRCVSFSRNSSKLPTVTQIPSGSGTYTPPTGCVALDIVMTGGGAGGMAGSNGGPGGAGGNTTFGGFTAAGGTCVNGAAVQGSPGGGTSGSQAGHTIVFQTNGGGTDGNLSAGVTDAGRCGGASIFGSGGVGGSAGGAGGSAGAIGSGGGGGGSGGGIGNAGVGGGAGASLRIFTTSPAASYSYAVGGGGGGNGGPGAGGGTGGNGVGGIIYIIEYYN